MVSKSSVAAGSESAPGSESSLNKYVPVELLGRRSEERGGRKAASAFLCVLLLRAAKPQLINYVGMQRTVNRGFNSLKAKDTDMWIAAMCDLISPLCFGAGGCDWPRMDKEDEHQGGFTYCLLLHHRAVHVQSPKQR